MLAMLTLGRHQYHFSLHPYSPSVLGRRQYFRPWLYSLCSWQTQKCHFSLHPTHPLFLADTSTLGLGCTHPVLGRHKCHFSLQLYSPCSWQTPVSGQSSGSPSVLGRCQYQVSLQSGSSPTLAHTSVRLILHYGTHQCQVSL